MRVVRVLGMLAVTIPTPAAMAQELEVEPWVVEECFETGRDQGRSLPPCVGAAAARCQNRPGGGTTLGISQCLMAETGAWAGLMQTALARKSQTLSQKDPGLAQALAATQAAWAAYREAECGLQYRVWIEGSIRTIVAGNCHLRKTAARALEVNMLGDLE